MKSGLPLSGFKETRVLAFLSQHISLKFLTVNVSQYKPELGIANNGDPGSPKNLFTWCNSVITFMMQEQVSLVDGGGY